MGFIKPSNVVGTMELLPSEQILFDNVKNIIEDTFKKRGFLPLDTPVFEKNEILLAKGGGETTKQIFKIDSESKDISLRFDLTVPLARYVAQYFNSSTTFSKPIFSILSIILSISALLSIPKLSKSPLIIFKLLKLIANFSLIIFEKIS